MSKKHFQAIARAIHETKPDPEKDREEHFAQWRFTRERLAEVLASDNERFDRARFIEACETGRCKGMPR